MANSGSQGGATPPSAYPAGRRAAAGEKHFAASAERNSGPIIEVLRTLLPTTGRALEVASGTGQHSVAFACAFSGIDWQPSDPDASARTSIALWQADEGLPNTAPPLSLDTTAPDWETALEPDLDAVLCINMIHIAPWAACAGLLRGAGALLKPGGVLYLYGPYKRDGRHTAPSNEAFDESLRSRNPDWGVRDVGEVADRAREIGLELDRTVEMPTNNLSVVFRRRS